MPDGMDLAIPAGIIGSLLTMIGNFAIYYYKNKISKNNINNIIETKKSFEEKRTISDQMSLLLSSSEKYREEVRLDMENLRQQMKNQNENCTKEIEIIKDKYEKEIEKMKTTVETLTKEVENYRRDNALLYLILREKGIDVPDWVKPL